MNLQSLNKATLHLANRKKKWLITLAVLGVSSYSAYKLYNLPSLVRKRDKMVKFFGILITISDLVSDSAETIGIVTRDLNNFLKSDSDEVPNSLKQLMKVVRSTEFTGSVSCVSEALTVGILRGWGSASGLGPGSGSRFGDKLIERILSSEGSGFVSVVAGSFARNLVLGFYSDCGDVECGDSVPRWVRVMCDDKCRELVAECVQKFVSTAVAVYLDKTMDINACDELFSGLTNPKHQDQMKDVLVSVCNGAVETLVKTSYHVLSASSSLIPGSSSRVGSKGSCIVVDECEGSDLVGDGKYEQEGDSEHLRERSHDVIENNGWVRKVSSTLAVPSNMKFVIDVTGRVTFESIRLLVEFLLWKITDGLKRSMNVVREELVDNGLQIVRYVGAKSSVIISLCVALYLHILGGAKVLLPA